MSSECLEEEHWHLKKLIIRSSFGYRDGISQPAVEGVHTPLPGQKTVEQGYCTTPCSLPIPFSDL